MSFSSLPNFLIEPLVRAALAEDMGRSGDLTSEALIPDDYAWKAKLVVRRDGVLAGMDFARMAFALFDTESVFDPLFSDGSPVRAGDAIARVSGRARSLLAVERTAVNFISHLSGIATATRRLVDTVRPYKAQICCTRKTTPGLRMIEKYAVRAGGGRNHRFGLDDGLVIKDNHIAVVGDVRMAMKKARAAAGHMMKIVLEVDRIEQLQKVLDIPPDVVLLDNMRPEQLAEAVQLVGGRFLTEASGGVTPDNIFAIAASGVDIISVGSITHSAPILDVALDDGF